MPPISPGDPEQPLVQEALSRLLRREARCSLLRFACHTFPNYRPASHHERIAAALEAVERGETDRLMIFMPPRHGKSELASRRFPAWCLGRDPRRQIIAATYNQELASSFGREVRAILASEEYRTAFHKVHLSPDSQAAHRMHTAQGGSYYAAGVGGGITGRGADIAIIDDPVKDREEAESPTVRERVWDWFASTLYTRLSPAGAIVLIQTRWHEDDLAGRLLAKQGRKPEGEWEVLELPAISEAGAALWPERYSLDALERIRRNVGPREWSALFQQQPQPDEGTYFQREWFREWEVKPDTLNVYGSSDYAVSEGKGDYTVHQVWGMDSEGMLYRLEQWRGRTAPDEWIERKLDLIAKWKPFAWFGEAGTIQKAIAPALDRRMSERKTWCRLAWLSSIAGKEANAYGFMTRLAGGQIRFEPGADISEYLAFPAGKHDDQVDASGLIGRALEQMHPAIVGVDGKPAPPKDRWDLAWERWDAEPKGTWMSA